MRECLLNFVQDLFKFPWTREEFLRCNSFRESYDVFRDRIGDCSFEEYVEFFKEFNLECSTLEKSAGKLSDEQLEQISGGGIGRFIAIPMVALTLLSGAANVTSFASINAPIAVSAKARANTQATVQDEWEKTRDFVARAGDPWLSMLPVEGEEGFKEYTKPEVDFDKNGEKVVLGKVQENGSRNNVYSQIYEIVQSLIKDADDDKSNLPKDLKRAKYIYEWVAKNIKYDYKLYDRIKPQNYDPSVPENSEYDATYRENPGVVFERKDGVCAGFARLARLMMRMAKIPCAYIVSPVDKSTGVGHAFNAIYVEKTNGQKGWTLMDATWGMQNNENTELDKRMLHDYFPAAYNNKSSLKEDNRSVMQETYHQVKDIDEDYGTSYILNGVKYTVNDDSISVSSEEAGAQLSLQIPESILALNKKIEIGEGIERYKCSKTEEIDISNATNLKEVNTEDSERYKFEGGVLYDNGKAVKILLDIGAFHYRLRGSYVYVYADSEAPDFPEIPDSILSLNRKIKIGDGITKYKCSGSEEIDISEAIDLEEINTEDSKISKDKNAPKKYTVEDFVLYENDGNENKKAVGVLPDINKGIRYSLDDSSITVSVSDYTHYTKDAFVKIPDSILALNKKIKIGSGIEKYRCSGTEEIDISYAGELTEINTEDSKTSNDSNAPKKYTFEGGVLYEKGKAVGMLKNVNGVNYSPRYDSMIIYSELPEVKIPEPIVRYLSGLHYKIKIDAGAGIEKYICSDNEEIDISDAKKLKSIDTSNSKIYEKFEDGVLYYKNGGKVAGITPKGDFHYTVDNDSISVFSYYETPNTLEIPAPILKLNKKIKIGSGIEKYKCSDNEEIDISGATSLQSIDTKDSKIYEKFENGVLYKKGGKVANLKPGASVEIDGFKYSRNNADSIFVSHNSDDSMSVPDDSADPASSVTLKIPQEILALDCKIKIGSGIGTYICSDNEEIDISEATSLQSIDTTDSKIYEKFEDGVLYNKKDGSIAGLLSTAKIGEVNYNIRDDSIFVFSTATKPVDLKIKKEILDMHRDKKIEIGYGIKKYICSGDEEIDISGAYDLKNIVSTRYKFEGGVLYEKGKAVGFLPKIDEVSYIIDDDSIFVYSVPEKPVDLKIKKEILDMHKGKKVKIGEGIKKYTCSGDEEIDISGAFNLKELVSSTRYTFEDGVLYEKGKAVGILSKTGKFHYSIDDSTVTVSAANGTSNTLKIPDPILKLNKKIKIGYGIKKYKYSGNEEIDISEATDLKSIKGQLGRYSKFEDGILYEKDGETGKDKVAGITPRGDFYYTVNDDSSISVSSHFENSVTLRIPKPLLKLNPRIKIESGVTKYKCSGTEEIDISKAKDLEAIDMPQEGRYSEFEDGKLYDKSGQVVGERLET